MTPRIVRVTQSDNTAVSKYRVNAYPVGGSSVLTVDIPNPGNYPVIDLNLDASGIFSGATSGTSFNIKVQTVGFDGYVSSETEASNNPVALHKDPLAPSSVLIVP